MKEVNGTQKINRKGDERVWVDSGPDLHYGNRQAEMKILSEGLMYYPVRRGLVR